MSDEDIHDMMDRAHYAEIREARLRIEVDRLKAENERFKQQVEQLTVAGIHTCHDECQRVACVLRREVEKLKADNEQLRADAERYRWICRFPEEAEYAIAHALNGCDGTGDGPSFRDLLSDAIDAALAAKGET